MGMAAVNYFVLNQSNFIFKFSFTKSYIQMNVGTRESIEWFKGNLTNLADMINDINFDFIEKSTLNSAPKQPQINNYLSRTLDFESMLNVQTEVPSLSSSVYWMLQDPINANKYPSSNKTLYEKITNEQIDSYNKAAINIL